MKQRINSHKITAAPQPVVQKFTKTREGVFARFPLLFTLLGTFGVVATFYGFERIIDKTWLADHPFTLLLIGILTLVLTGTLYKRLG